MDSHGDKLPWQDYPERDEASSNTHGHGCRSSLTAECPGALTVSRQNDSVETVYLILHYGFQPGHRGKCNTLHRLNMPHYAALSSEGGTYGYNASKHVIEGSTSAKTVIDRVCQEDLTNTG